MLKKFLIICLCVCCMLSLFNMGGNWNYDGLKTAFERVEDQSSFLQTTYNECVLLFDIIPARFSFDAENEILVYERWTKTSDDFYGIYFAVERRHGGGGRPFGDGSEEELQLPDNFDPSLYGDDLVQFSTREERDKVYEDLMMFISVPHYSSDDPFAEVLSVLGTFVYSFMIVFTIIEMLVVSTIDFAKLVFALVGSCFYLLFG